METTKKHYELFVKEAKKWIEIFGLKDYDIHFGHEELDNLAECGVNDQAKLCKIYLSKIWEGEIELTNNEIKRTACHEVIELLLVRLRAYADNKNGTSDLVDGETHRIIQILINTFYRGKEDAIEKREIEKSNK